MALTEQQMNQIRYQMGIKVPDTNPVDTSSTTKSNFLSGVKPAGQTNIPIKPTFIEGVALDAKKRNTAMVEAQQSKQNIGSKILQTFGQGFGLVTDIAKRGTSSLTTTAEEIAPESVGAFKQGFNQSIKDIVSTDTGKSAIEALSRGQESYAQFKISNPEAAANIEASVDIASVVPILQGLRDAGLLTSAIGTGVKNVTKNSLTGIADAGKSFAESASPLLDTTKNIANSVIDTAKLAGGGLSRIPGRVSTNIAEKKALQESIQSLPTMSAKKAVQDGVDVEDMRYFSSIPKEQKPQVAKLVKSVQDFESGKTKVNPIEVVGKPMTEGLNRLKAQRKVVGEQLSKEAEKLGNVTPDMTTPNVLDSLKKVQGLEGIKLADNGTLDFTDTVMSSMETSGDRKVLQSIFTDATKAGTGKQKHLLRQELREALGGKKQAQVQITETLDKSYEAVRQGLSNTLDTINPNYKRINAEYAKVANPLKDLARELKIKGEIDDDVLNLSAGLMARRLTSNSISNPRLRNILKNVDIALKTKGKTLTSLETLQDSLNRFSKYYNIDQKTGYKALTQEATSAGLKDFVSNAVTDIAGKTDAVRKKALEEALKELLSN